MTSQHEVVILDARLTGMGRDELCTVLAVKVSVPSTGEFQYVHPGIHNAPDDLPDGRYTLHFGAESSKVTKSGRFWLADES